MEFRDFCEEVRDQIGEYLVNDFENIKMETIIKNNGVELVGLVITRQGNDIAPNIYLNEYYDLYEQDIMGMEEICGKISEAYGRALQMVEQNQFEVDNMFENARDNVFVKAVNYNMNRERLEHIVHDRFLDLALEVRILIQSDKMGIASTSLTLNELEKTGMTRSEAIQIAKENTERLFPVSLQNMGDVIPLGGIGQVEMYVLSNKQGVNGATHITNEKVLQDFVAEHGDTYILPSSIHEVLLIPAEQCPHNAESLAEMVKEVNQFVVNENEVLSNNVYTITENSRKVELCKDVSRDDRIND